VRPIRSTTRLLAVLTLCTLTAVACSDPRRPPRTTSTSTTTTTTTPPVPTNLLLEYTSHGGLCGRDGCDRRITITTFGVWTFTGERGITVRGQFEQSVTQQLALMARAGIGSLTNLPPAPGCPSLRDGVDVTYRFHLNSSVTTVSNCTHVLPRGNQLLAQTDLLIQRVIAIATATSPAPLLEWTSSGGMCPAELCAQRITITVGGTWHFVGGGRDVEGQLGRGIVESLAGVIGTDIETLDTLPPALHCPSIVDGSDITYRFHTRSGIIAVSNCDRVIPSGNRLLLTVDGILRQIVERATAENKPLVDWSSIGGLCPWGGCSRGVTIDQDGSWRATNGTNTREGTLDPATATELRDHVRRGLDGLATLATSDGMCPSSYDGQDVVFRFFVDGRGREVSNCTRVIPGSNELLLYVQGIVTPIAQSIPNPPPVRP
jgi:hypothetical protein